MWVRKVLTNVCCRWGQGRRLHWYLRNLHSEDVQFSTVDGDVYEERSLKHQNVFTPYRFFRLIVQEYFQQHYPDKFPIVAFLLLCIRIPRPLHSIRKNRARKPAKNILTILPVNSSWSFTGASGRKNESIRYDYYSDFNHWNLNYACLQSYQHDLNFRNRKLIM